MSKKDGKSSDKRDSFLDERGKFKPGNPGGPGRPRGVTSIRHILKKTLSKEREEEILRKYMEKVESGELLTDYLDRRYGKSKPLPEPIDIELPDVSTAEGAVEAYRMLTEAVLAGADRDQVAAAKDLITKAQESGQWREAIDLIAEMKKESTT